MPSDPIVLYYIITALEDLFEFQGRAQRAPYHKRDFKRPCNIRQLAKVLDFFSDQALG